MSSKVVSLNVTYRLRMICVVMQLEDVATRTVNVSKFTTQFGVRRIVYREDVTTRINYCSLLCFVGC